MLVLNLFSCPLFAEEVGHVGLYTSTNSVLQISSWWYLLSGLLWCYEERSSELGILPTVKTFLWQRIVSLILNFFLFECLCFETRFQGACSSLYLILSWGLTLKSWSSCLSLSNSSVKDAAINTGQGPHPDGPVYSCENWTIEEQS